MTTQAAYKFFVSSTVDRIRAAARWRPTTPWAKQIAAMQKRIDELESDTDDNAMAVIAMEEQLSEEMDERLSSMNLAELIDLDDLDISGAVENCLEQIDWSDYIDVCVVEDVVEQVARNLDLLDNIDSGELRRIIGEVITEMTFKLFAK